MTSCGSICSFSPRAKRFGLWSTGRGASTLWLKSSTTVRKKKEMGSEAQTGSSPPFPSFSPDEGARDPASFKYAPACPIAGGGPQGVGNEQCVNPPGASCLNGNCNSNRPLTAGRWKLPPTGAGTFAPGGQGPSTEVSRPFALHEAADRPFVWYSDPRHPAWAMPPGHVAPAWIVALRNRRNPNGNHAGDWTFSTSNAGGNQRYIACYQLIAHCRAVGVSYRRPKEQGAPLEVCSKDRWLIRGVGYPNGVDE